MAVHTITIKGTTYHGKSPLDISLIEMAVLDNRPELIDLEKAKDGRFWNEYDRQEKEKADKEHFENTMKPTIKRQRMDEAERIAMNDELSPEIRNDDDRLPEEESASEEHDGSVKDISQIIDKVAEEMKDVEEPKFEEAVSIEESREDDITEKEKEDVAAEIIEEEAIHKNADEIREIINEEEQGPDETVVVADEDMGVEEVAVEEVVEEEGAEETPEVEEPVVEGEIVEEPEVIEAEVEEEEVEDENAPPVINDVKKGNVSVTVLTKYDKADFVKACEYLNIEMEEADTKGSLYKKIVGYYKK